MQYSMNNKNLRSIKIDDDEKEEEDNEEVEERWTDEFFINIFI